MPSPSPLSTALFCTIVLIVALAVAYAIRRAGAGVLPIIGMVVAYLVVPGVLARQGVLNRYSPLPAPALVMIAVLVVLTIVATLSPLGGRLAQAIPIGAVIALQAFRIAVEWVLHRLHLEGVVPVQMTFSGRNFDIVSGLSGLALGWWILRGRAVPRAVVLAWNVLGLALLLNIIAVAVLSTPVPFRHFTEGPPNLLPSTFPYVWLPSFLVPMALGSHLLVFRKLARPTAG